MAWGHVAVHFLVCCGSVCAAQKPILLNVTGRVVEGARRQPIPAARVILEIWSKTSPLVAFTSPAGQFAFTVEGRQDQLAGRLIVTRDTYLRVDVPVDGSTNKPVEIV